MERIVTFSPAYDRRATGYGVHGVDLQMVLKGTKGAVQFVLYTNWQLPQVTKELVERAQGDRMYLETRFLPLPADVGYHSPVPQYEGQAVIQEECEYLDGRPCYYDGSGLAAEEMYQVLVQQGSEGVWRKLEQRYKDLFGEKGWRSQVSRWTRRWPGCWRRMKG